MEKNMWVAFVLVSVGALLIGGMAGMQLFPKVVEVTRDVVVPGPIQTVEVPVEVEKVVEVKVEKIVEVENTEKLDALQKEYDSLQRRYEQLIDAAFDEDELNNELNAIERAKDELEVDWMHLFLKEDYSLREVSIDKFYDEDAIVREVKRYVDGKRVDYDKATVTFSVKVRYEDGDRVEFDRYDVRFEWDIDSDGYEEAEVEVELVD